MNMILLDIKENSKHNVSIIKNLLENAHSYVSINRTLLNNLNVFPVPDGDTGDNMSLTIAEGLNKAKNDVDKDPIKFLDVFSTRCMNMSRGNSGIIIARFIRGFVEVLIENKTITYDSVLKGFEKGSDYARKSMVKPKEGTMITIIDEAYRVFSENFNNNMTIKQNFMETIKKTVNKLYETPDMLPVLGKGGVVDAGALGFIFFMKGLLYKLDNKILEQENEEDYRVEVREVDESLLINNKMRYCFEFTINCNGECAEEFKQKILDLGDSISVTNSNELTKVHIHTNDTNKVKSIAGEYGKVGSVKIDDMFAQSEKYSKVSDDLPEILAILPGVGYESVYSDLNVTNFLVYEDILPTTGEIEEKIKTIDSDNIIVIVNNSNVIPSVRLCQENLDKNIYIIPTKNIAEGITSLFDFNPTLSTEENVQNMKDSLEFAPVFMKLSKSIKDTQFGDSYIKEGDYFVIHQDNIIASSKGLSDSILKTLVTFDMDEKGVVSLYYNKKCPLW